MNTNLFDTSNSRGKSVPATNAVNEAGGVAYARPHEEELAQLAVTGCFGNTFYTKAEDQLTRVLNLASKCSPEFIAQTAVYARQEGLMKDMPAVLCAILATRSVPLLKAVWSRCINDVKMLRNFVQVIRSGVTGRKSFGTAVQRLIQGYFASKTAEQIFRSSLGTKPSIGDIIKMVHPKPKDQTTSMTYAYLMGKEVAARGVLPQVLQDYLAFREDQTRPMPDLNFQFLSSLPLSKDQWTQLCRTSSWTTLRMNLNTFQRHGVFEDAKVVKEVIARLTDKEEIRKAKPMPYQLFAAYANMSNDIPPGIRLALARAADLSLSNIPDLPDNLVIGVDVSGSMQQAITGARGATSKVRCVDVAALFASALATKCPTARVIPFDSRYHAGFKVSASIVDTAEHLANFGGGSTDCSIPIRESINKKVDAVIIISDNESWVTNGRYLRGTGAMNCWRQLQEKNPKAKLVCIDITPSTTTQVVNEKNVMNIGGFSDAVFDVLEKFLNGSSASWLESIKSISLESRSVAAPVENQEPEAPEES
ncbi:MAG: hypothetical protein E6R03_13405 [Hyphomicrobiaceae bacterium]|nr:MAG: hypothetical protein E6R03_13405 [Hyphomicrobiaceae bacterium]